ncbi:MAG: HAD family hydrolase [Deltaproteobacteria bacterium]|nr:HAD family hydrolase [Deltaproteobacteria bacterium]
MGTKRIQGIIFDLDGTLYQMKFMKLKMTLQLLTSLVFLRKLSMARSALRHRHFENQEQLQREFHHRLAGLTGRSVDDARRWYEGDFYTAFIRILKKYAKTRTGLVPMLERLNERGVKLAVVSDFGWVPQRLDALGVNHELFDIVKCSEETGELKPGATPFTSVAEGWNLTPGQVMVVGDRADTDKAGAKRAGMRFLGVTDNPKAHADFYCWNDAMKIIEETTTNCGVNV